MKAERRVAVITGASMGLGYALAKWFLEAGWDVAFCARNEQRLKDAVQSLEQVGGQVRGYVGDVASQAFQSKFVDDILRDFGRMDALINNASILGDVPMPDIMQTSLDNLRTVFETNVFAPISLLQRCIPHLQEQAHSLSLCISSDAAIGGYAGWGVYGSSKAALDMLHKTVASELTNGSLICYTVDPSDMDTAMHHAASPGDEGLSHPADVAQAISGLFGHLSGHSQPPFPNGSRLQVQGKHLIPKEVG